MQASLLLKNSTNVRFVMMQGWRHLALPALGRVAPGLLLSWLEQRFLTPDRHDWPQAERVWLDSAQRGALYTVGLPVADWNFQRIQTYRWGPDGLPKVVLLHGWGGRATQLGPFIQPLLDAGYQVHAVDLPGHGHSAGRRSSVLHALNAFERLLREIGPVQGVIAHSMGGGVLIKALSQGAPVGRAVLVAPNGDLGLYSRIVARVLGLSEKVRLALQQRLEWRIGVRWDEINALNLAPALRTPALVMHDHQDREIPHAMGESIAAAWPGARLISTVGLGHKRILKDAQVVAQTVAFLRGG